MLIFLIGFMGSGKSHVGKKLAELLKYSFIDTDEWIEKKKGKTIKQIFELQGEPAFREMEKEALTRLLKEKNTVVAAGGGMPCYFNNMERMNKNGITVYMELEEGILFHRLVHEKTNRPLISHLSDVELMEFINDTLFDRRSIYEQAQFKVNAATITAQKLKEKIQKESKGRK